MSFPVLKLDVDLVTVNIEREISLFLNTSHFVVLFYDGTIIKSCMLWNETASPCIDFYGFLGKYIDY